MGKPTVQVDRDPVRSRMPGSEGITKARCKPMALSKRAQKRVTSERTYEADLYASNGEHRLGGKKDLSFQRVAWPERSEFRLTHTALKNLDV